MSGFAGELLDCAGMGRAGVSRAWGTCNKTRGVTLTTSIPGLFHFKFERVGSKTLPLFIYMSREQCTSKSRTRFKRGKYWDRGWLH